MTLRINICQILLFLFSVKASGQTGLLHYNVNNGLSQNSVTCIYRDWQGIVWIGTQDGLNRFDGYHFRTYKYNPGDSNSISDQFVLSIQEDGGNNLIIGTRNGLNLFDRRREVFTRISPDGDKHKEIQYHFPRIEKLENGNLVFLESANIYEWDWRLKKVRKRINYLESGYYFSVYKDAYIQLDHEGNVFKSGETLTAKSGKDSKYYERVAQLNQFIDRNATIWLTAGTPDGNTSISFYDLKSDQWIKKKIQISGTVNHIFFDNNNQAWLSTNQGIRLSSDKNVFDNLSIYGEALKGEVQCTYTDAEGLTWIGFTNNGIGLYNPEVNAYHLFSSGLSNDPAYASLVMKNGDIWVAASSGLYLFEKGKKRKKVRDGYCISLAMDQYENVWLGTQNAGIVILDKSGKKTKELNRFNSELATNQIFHLQFDSVRQRILASTPIGFFIYSVKSKSSRIFQADKGELAGDYVLHSFVDSKENIWISSNKGVDVYDANLEFVKRIKSENENTPIKKTIVTACSEDFRGNIWITTLSSGIYKYDGKILKQYNTENGLSSNYCYGVCHDSDERIWVTTTSGISILNTSDEKIYRLTEQNALPTIDYSIGSLHRALNGKLYTGSPDGIIEIDPALVVVKQKFYKPVISNVVVDYLPAAIDSVYDLPSNSHQISFEFVAPCYINSAKLIYQYRIVGISDNWATVQSDNRILNLVELPFRPVKVEFRTAFSKDLLENTPVTSVDIHRQLPLWRKPVILLVEIIILIFGLSMLIRYLLKKRIDKKMKEVELMESIYKERERISRDLHDHLGAYAVAIKSNIIQAEKETSDSVPFQQLKENAEGMVSSLRETIWALQHENISITAISDRFKNNINRLSINYPDISIDVSEDIRKDIVLSPSESIQLIRIMQEAITNALKHAGGKNINIRLFCDNHLEITISDDGVGFILDGEQRGYGVKNMKERAKEAGFHLHINSSSVGTVISIKKQEFN